MAATSGERSARVAEEFPKPDLILLEAVMEGMDGYAVFDRLRDNPRTRDIPIIVLTALNDSGDEEWGLLLGAADYIEKPISRAVVRPRVRPQLERFSPVIG